MINFELRINGGKFNVSLFLFLRSTGDFVLHPRKKMAFFISILNLTNEKELKSFCPGLKVVVFVVVSGFIDKDSIKSLNLFSFLVTNLSDILILINLENECKEKKMKFVYSVI